MGINADLITIFLTGLITGGLTCMAVQGGLLAATIAQREEVKLGDKLKSKGKALPIIAFLIAKLIAYSILGFFLGLLGSFFTLSITTRVILQIAVVVFMVGTALSILEVHPIFRYFIIQPPKFLTRLVRKQSKSEDIFAPAILGAFTIFIPCGTTQAMMALAVASGKPITGALILAAFVLGTSPLFFILGYFATKLGSVFEKQFMRIAAIVLIGLAIFNLSNALALKGIEINIGAPLKQAYCIFAVCDSGNAVATAGQVDENPTITIKSLGYFPNSITVRAGSNVNIKLQNLDNNSCAQAFTIPSLGIEKLVTPGNSDVVSFKAPNSPTEIPFMCSMGMYRGVIKVI